MRSGSWNYSQPVLTGLVASAVLMAPIPLVAHPIFRRAIADQVSAQTIPAPSTPSADYATYDDARMDGRRAVGRTALLSVWRSNTTENTIDVFPCDNSPGLASVHLSYPSTLRDHVRAMPTGSLHCARVHFRITGHQRFGGGLVGTVLAILDVEPIAADAPSDSTVDFTNIDDVNMAGSRARHRIAELQLYRSDTDDRRFTAHVCGDHGGFQSLHVSYSPALRDLVRDIPTSSVDGCRTVRVRLQRQDFMHTWSAELLTRPTPGQ